MRLIQGLYCKGLTHACTQIVQISFTVINKREEMGRFPHNFFHSSHTEEKKWRFVSIVLPPSSTAAVNFKRYPRSQLITRHKIKPLCEGKWRRANGLALGPDKLQQQNMAIYITIRCANKTKRDKSLNNLQCKITARVYILHHHIVTQQKGCVFSKHPWTWCTRNRE